MQMDMEPTSCSFCGQLSSLLCQRCYESYCSMQCQMLDWSKHKLICTPMPQLIPRHRLNQSVNNCSFDIVPLNNLNQLVMQNCQQQTFSNSTQARSKIGAPNFAPMRRPRSENEKNCTIEPKIGQNLPFVTSNGAINKTDVDDYNEKNLFKTKTRPLKINNQSSTDFNKNNIDGPKLMTDSVLAKAYFKFDHGSSNITDELTTEEELLGSSKMKHPWKTPFEIPKEKFFNAIVQHYDSKQKIAWITDSSLHESQIKFLRQINSDLKNMPQAAKNNIFKDALYAAEFDNEFYRAICLEEVNSSNQVKVRLIDYGNMYLTDYQKLKLPVAIMNNLHCFAFCIYYPNQIGVGKKIKIKIFNKILEPIVGDIYLVEEDINGEVIKYTKNISSILEPIRDFSAPKNNALNSLPDEFDLKLINFIDNKNKKTAFVQIVQKKVRKELDNMNDILNSEKTFNYDLIDTPKKGDFIVGRCGKFWKRGVVVDKYEKEFLVFFTDFGEIEFVEQLKRIPTDYRGLAHQIALIDIIEILIDEKTFLNRRFVHDIKLKIKNFTLQDSTSKCYLLHENVKLANVTLKNFEGNLIELMQNNLWYMKPTHLNTVRITNVFDHCTIYIAIDSICDSYRLKINAIGKKLEEEFQLLQQNPELKINSIVVVKLNTSEYFRCRILNLEEKEEWIVVVVEDIDLGKIYTVKNDSIFTANDLLKLMPVTSAKYSLNILDKIQPSNAKLNKGLQQLNSYCKDKNKFILKIENPDESGIVLSPVDDNTQTINKTLIPLLFEEMDREVVAFEQNKKEIEINSQSKKDIVNNIVEVKLDNENKNKSNAITKYYLKDIEVSPIKCGEKVKLLILDNSELKRGIITAGVPDLEFFTKLSSDYQYEINKYCNDPNNGSNYLPEQDELCLAIFDEDDQWYRALCLTIFKNGKASLMFLDFGNTIIAEPNKIRKFHKSFLYKSLANTCLIEEFPVSPDEKKLDNLAKTIFKPYVVFIADSVKEIGDCEYSIQFLGIDKYFQK